MEYLINPVLMGGTVKEICVSEGDTVKGGQLLMRIE